MANSFKDALLKSGLVRAEDTDEARRERGFRERREKEAASFAEKGAGTARRRGWEAAPTGRIVDGARPAGKSKDVLCSECGEPFAPEKAERRVCDRCVEARG